MIQLQRVRLINWHNFVDNILSFQKITYLIGVNAVGKTTILDAIRYCLTTNKNFNALGNRKSARTLQGSVHGKQRGENVYTRRGHTVSYIGVEFLDQAKKKTFVITARVESESPEQEMRHIQQTWYISPNGTKLEDLPFIDHSTNAPSSKEKFSIPTGRMQPIDKQNDARTLICQKLGIGKADSPLGRKFSSVFPMGTSLDEIPDFRTFIFDYILPQPEMDLDALQKDEQELENLQETLTQAQRQAQRLKEIVELGYEALDKERDVNINQGFIAYAVHQSNLTKEEQYSRDLDVCRDDLRRLDNQYEEAQRQEDIAHDAYMKAWEARRNSDEEQFLEVLREKAQEISRNLSASQKNVTTFLNTQKEVSSLLEDASGHFPVNMELLPEKIRTYPERSQAEMLRQLDDAITKLRPTIENAFVELKQQSNQIKETSVDLEERIRKLEQGQWVYPDRDSANLVKKAINDELTVQGKEPDARVLCELLYMNDESWQDCVESNLGNRRFDILVRPEHYVTAKHAFEKLGESVGKISLLDSPALHRDQNKIGPINDGSLAAKVSSESPLAMCYVGDLLGRIMCCENTSDLEKFPHSASRNLLRHYPYRLARLKKQDRYIGLNARKQQLADFKKQYQQLKKQIVQIESESETAHNLMLKTQQVIGREDVSTIIELWDSEQKHLALVEANSKVQEEISEWEKNPLLRGLLSHENHMRSEWEHAKAQCKDIAGKKKVKEASVSDYESKIEAIVNAKKSSQGAWDAYCNDYSLLVWEVEAKFAEARKKNTPEQIALNQTNYQRQLENARDRFVNNQLIPSQQQFNQEYSSDLTVGMEGLEFFEARYRQLDQIDLVRYTASLNKAKDRCRERFRRDILYRMKDDISNAKRQFRDLSRIMQGLSYGEESYQFRVQESKDPDMARFYHLIMNEQNMETTSEPSLFNMAAMDDPAYESQVDELVERILSAAKNVAENRQTGKRTSEKQMIQWIDYRQYLDYDIIITNSKTGEAVPLSKVSQDSSGGENQAPFYIAICASLLQIYLKCENGIRLVLLDEAFSKMTSDRIKPMMQMFRQMQLQVVLITTVEKASAICPLCDVTYSIVKNGSRNAIAPFFLEVDDR